MGEVKNLPIYYLTEKLAKVSVPNTEFYLTEIKADGNRKTSKLPTVDPNRKTAYWLQRRTFLQLLFIPKISNA